MITYHDTSTSFSTGIYIKPADWEKTKQLTKPKNDEEKALKLLLGKFEPRINKIIAGLEDRDQEITARIIKDILLKKRTLALKDGPKIYLKSIIKELVADKISLVNKDRRSPGTLTKYYTTEKHLDNFLQKHLKVKDIWMDELNYKFVKDFYHYLINDKIVNGKKEVGMCNNTAQKYIQTLRCSVFFALKMDYIYRDPFKMWEYEWDNINTVYLTKSELAKIENFKFPNERLQVVADIFLLTCYTGIAPADLQRLTRNNLEFRGNDRYWLVLNRKKTNGLSEIMLFKKTESLIEKYRHDSFCVSKNLILPYRANQTMNEYLKEVAHMCGITKRLTHYVGRHTFATTVMLSNGASLETVKRALGHARVTQTEHYAKILDEKVTEEMQRVDANLQNNSTNYEEMAMQRDAAKQNATDENQEIKIIQLNPLSEKPITPVVEIPQEKNMLYTRRKLAKKRIG